MTAKSAYTELCKVYTRLHRFNHVASIVSWDRNAMMPPAGNQARAEAEAELGMLIHRMRTDPKLADWLRAAEDESLDDFERVTEKLGVKGE